MSEDYDRRYARLWDPFIIGLMTLVALALLAGSQRSEIRDLQRRIAILEQR